MKDFFQINLYALAVMISYMGPTLASSGQAAMPAMDESEKSITPPIQQKPAEQQQTAKEKPNVPQKVGREAARLHTQAEDAARDIKHGWKNFKKKHKEKRKQ